MTNEYELLELLTLFYAKTLDSSRYMRLIILLLLNSELINKETKKLYDEFDEELNNK